MGDDNYSGADLQIYFLINKVRKQITNEGYCIVSRQLNTFRNVRRDVDYDDYFTAS